MSLRRSVQSDMLSQMPPSPSRPARTQAGCGAVAEATSQQSLNTHTMSHASLRGQVGSRGMWEGVWTSKGTSPCSGHLILLRDTENPFVDGRE